MIKPLFNKFLILALGFLFLSSANALEQADYKVIKKFIEAIKSNDKAKLANVISYPLRRSYPIPYIEDKKEFLERYDEVFDESLIKIIVGSDLEKDWRKNWQGISLANGGVWLDDEGKVIAVNHQTKTEENIKNKLINDQRKTLHQSIREYTEPILEWETKKFRIRIDRLATDKYRYVAWAVNKKSSEKPDLILYNGEYIPDGNGGNHNYTFSNGIYQYKCFVTMIGTGDEPPGELMVYKNNKLILSDPVVKFWGE